MDEWVGRWWIGLKVMDGWVGGGLMGDGEMLGGESEPANHQRSECHPVCCCLPADDLHTSWVLSPSA